MKKTHLFFFFSLVLPVGLFGQSTVIVPNTENYGQNGIVYNNALFFSNNYFGKLAKLEGGVVTVIPDPLYNNQPIFGGTSGNMVIYNNKLCYIYGGMDGNWQIHNFIVTYDGSVQKSFKNPIDNPSRGIMIGDNGSDYEPVVLNNKLILKGSQRRPMTNNLFVFDDQSLTIVENIDDGAGFLSVEEISLGNNAIIHNNELYFSYKVGSMTDATLMKFNGTSLVDLNLYNTNTSFRGRTFNQNGTLYSHINQYTYGPSSTTVGLGVFTPGSNTFSMLPIPGAGPSGPLVGRALTFNSSTYFIVSSGVYPDYNFQLVSFDGTNVQKINNVSTSDVGPNSQLVTFANDIYFQYINSEKRNVLGKLSGGSISLTPNLTVSDIGVGKSFVKFNGELYFTYKKSATSPDTAPSYLAKYDGQNITVFPNPDSGQGVQDSKFVVYGNDLYFPYKNAAGVTVLAKYGSTVLATKEIKKKSKISVFKNNDVFSVISEEKEILNIEVMDASGRMISNEKVNKKYHNLPINKTGVFIIKVILKDGEVFTQKIRS